MNIMLRGKVKHKESTLHDCLYKSPGQLQPSAGFEVWIVVAFGLGAVMGRTPPGPATFCVWDGGQVTRVVFSL